MRGTSTTTRPSDLALSDAELLTRTRDGDESAYALLYERHRESARAAAWCLTRSTTETEDVVADVFTQILATLRRGHGPEHAFRPYLLTSVRNACSRRRPRAVPVDPGVLQETAPAVERDGLAALAETSLVARAFVSLPERWQQVLWKTEVEGRSPSEVAEELQLAPGAVAALSYRARKALSEAYLHAHIMANPAPPCRATAERLAGYVRRSASRRDRTAVEQHLADCESCRRAEAELREINRSLRNVLVPVLGGLAFGARVIGIRGALRTARRAVGQVAFSATAAVTAATVVALPVLLPSSAPATEGSGLAAAPADGGAGLVLPASGDETPALATPAASGPTVVAPGTGGAPADEITVPLLSLLTMATAELDLEVLVPALELGLVRLPPLSVGVGLPALEVRGVLDALMSGQVVRDLAFPTLVALLGTEVSVTVEDLPALLRSLTGRSPADAATVDVAVPLPEALTGQRDAAIDAGAAVGTPGGSGPAPASGPAPSTRPAPTLAAPNTSGSGAGQPAPAPPPAATTAPPASGTTAPPPPLTLPPLTLPPLDEVVDDLVDGVVGGLLG